MPRPLLIFSQSDYSIQVVDTNSHSEWQTVQIQISWLLQKPTDLDLHCLQRQGISGFSRTWVKLIMEYLPVSIACRHFSLQFLNLVSHCSTTDSFGIVSFQFDLTSFALCEFTKLRSVQSLVLSFHLFFCQPLFLGSSTLL